MRSLFPLLSGVLLIFLTGCSGEGPGQVNPLQPSHKPSMPTLLRIVIQWPGDDFAARQDLETRSRIEGLLLERGVGRIVKSGTGMGWMDTFVEAQDWDRAKRAIREVMREAAPAAKYRIESVFPLRPEAPPETAPLRRSAAEVKRGSAAASLAKTLSPGYGSAPDRGFEAPLAFTPHPPAS